MTAITSTLHGPTLLRAGTTNDVLTHLFHQVLNVERDQRLEHPNSDIEPLLREIPFLNGSIFAQQAGDEQLTIPMDAYWSRSLETPGLFTILSRFQWTMEEHTGETTDRTLDPELLGNLLERIVHLTEKGPVKPNRKPKGTYYTPRDVVDVMIVDAIAARLQREPGVEGTVDELRNLLTGTSDGTSLSIATRQTIYAALQRYTFFDPAVGSGAFLLAILEILRATMARLEVGLDTHSPHARSVHRIIRDQLHGADIQPLAAQVTKLRLFLAIKASERNAGDPQPLPNLEARIAVADSLCTTPDPDWTPHQSGSIDDIDRTLQDLLLQLTSNRRQWFDTHDPVGKNALQQTDRALLQRFRAHARKNATSEANMAFAEWSPLSLTDAIARTDLRLVFSTLSSVGFDIVIGNPPYDSNRKGPGRLETAFTRIAAALASKDHGVVELVLPLGVSFRADSDHQSLRGELQRWCTSIDLRHHDMTPGRIFNAMPTAKDWPNKVRAVLLTAVRTPEDGNCTVRTTGLRRWLSNPTHDERQACLGTRLTTSLPEFPGTAPTFIRSQWLRSPNQRISQLMGAISKEPRPIDAWVSSDPCNTPDSRTLGLPQSGYLFVPSLPFGTVTPRGETRLSIDTDEHFDLAFLALNGHVFYAWWLTIGDGFHFTEKTVRCMTVPNSWVSDPSRRAEARRLAGQLRAAVPQCITEKLNAGTRWRNVDFFSRASDLVTEIDAFHLQSMDMMHPDLLHDIRTLRSNSNWRISDR